jgi:hypothetical protein
MSTLFASALLIRHALDTSRQPMSASARVQMPQSIDESGAVLNCTYGCVLLSGVTALVLRSRVVNPIRTYKNSNKNELHE